MFKMRNETVISLVRPYTIAVPMAMTAEEHQAMHSQINPSSVSEHPHSFYFNNIFEEVGNTNSRIVAAIGGGVAWDYSLRNLLPDTVRGLMVVIKNSCDQAFTYRIDGKDAFFVGEGDQHNTKYTLEKEVDLAIHNNPDFFDTPDHCWYRLVSHPMIVVSWLHATLSHTCVQHIFPGEEFEATYETHTPIIYAIVLVVTFLVVIAVFIIYDKLVYKRNEKMIGSAARSNAIVSSLFPGNIRDRLMAQGTDGDSESDGMGQLVDRSSKPLADFFLETTVLFADIVGFTAWSSVRDPSQVFTLLEVSDRILCQVAESDIKWVEPRKCLTVSRQEIYRAFDELARRRRIYKVETVGDCYVAVAGLPEPRADHAVAMVQFAERILKRMDEVTKELEVSLGPDTSDLSLRIGIHSGPVTAGVLRGERARFQLFGDTVNTCSRMESTGSPGRIHISEDTANLIQKFGKGHWLEKRADAVAAKGKGLLQTYWVNYGTTAVETDIPASKVKANQEQHTERLIDWNATVLLDILREIMVKRGDKATSVVTTSEDIAKKATPLEEVKEVIELPKFKVGAADMTKVDLSQEVVDEVHAFVKRIAGMYLNNPFHCFDHASHVVMSVTKLLGRIVAPKQSDLGLQEQANLVDVAVTLHDHTYGITSDPLTQFACAFSALIHDVDHQGIPNPELCKEQPALAEQYKKRSVAEQNSLDLSWDLLMQDEFAHFRSALCATKHDLQHFRNLVVNSVMATDIMDKELKELRNARWRKAFDEQLVEDPKIASDRKATIVIAHLIQASDVSHTMQHWHIYRKWNQRLFHELYQAYVDGRAHKDPSLFWYKGEIGFFDFYIIPLAKKLKDCGVFGVSSDEFLSYALQNRNEWEERGQGIVSEMMQELKATPTASGSK